MTRILAALALFFAPSVHAGSQQTYLDALVDFERYAETIWHDATGVNQPTNSGYWGDGGSSGNGGIRGSCGIAVAYAVLVKAAPADPKTATRLSRITRALNYAANSHVTGPKFCVDGNKWGWSSASSTDWQTPEWSGSMGLACILVQSQLPAITVQDCQRVVASEATHRAGIAPASGYVSDTKAEENGWDSNILSLGASWLSGDPNAPAWLTAAKKYLANSYTVANTNGDPLASWITTVTLYPSYALENHGFYHPTYEMVAGMSMGDSLLMARLANTNVAAQLEPFASHNVVNVWSNNLQAMLLDSGEFGYPAGLDWELHDYEQNSYIAWLATQFDLPGARWADTQLASLVRHRQIVNADGRFVGPSGGGFYREAVEARRTAIAWLHWAYGNYTNGVGSAPGSGTAHYPDVEVIAQRSPSSFVSLSYGSRIMAMIEAPSANFPTNAFVATPLYPGVIGLGALGNPTAAQLVSLITNANGFDAELTLQNGANGTTEVYVKSTGETVGIVEVPWPGPAVVPTPAASFSVGIENDPLTGGTRLLEWLGGSANVTNRSSVSRNITNSWICVAGRYGLTAGPVGYFTYQAAGGYNRLGAAEDTLKFFPQNSLSARYAVWFPGQTAAQTAARSSQVQWSATGTNGVLTLPGQGTNLVQITVRLPSGTPPFPAYLLPISSVTASSSQAGFPPTNAVNGNLSDFWVSSGVNPGQGPTTNNPEWLRIAFPRQVAVSQFQVYPRTANGGYGPKTIQMLLNGQAVYQGTMAPTTPLDVRLSAPAYATNAQLLITSSYDPAYPTNSRNVQVVELSLFERAQPGTFGDWALHRFTDAQLADPAIGDPLADPDLDGVPNLVEFVTDSDPLLADSILSRFQPVPGAPGTFNFTFRERKDLADVQRVFERSTDLNTWTQVTPTTLINLTDLGTSWIRQATFAAPPTLAFFRLRFTR
ncbi:MAG TPA: discoidin domain-containing protein [Methylomirabilota bacterium]|nr:discoidin domain-containing protein [Methylomirabilota bacterium]